MVLVCDHLSSDVLIVLSLGLKPRMDCSRSLLSVFCSKKKVSLLFYKPRALVCMLALVSVQSLESMSEAHSVLRPLSW